MRIVQPVIEQLKAQSHPVCHYIYDLVGLEHHLQHITLLYRRVIVKCTMQ